MKTLKHAFAVEPDAASREGGLPSALERIALSVVKRRLEAPAIILLETIRPLNFLASQTMFAAWPLVKMAGGKEAFREVAESLEDRETLRRLADRIEELAGRGDRA